MAPRAVGRAFRSDGFHKWVGSVSAIAQAGAVIFGVWYAINELSDREEDKRERRIERIMEYVQRQHEAEMEEATAYLWRVTYSKKRYSAREFSGAVEPLNRFFRDLKACVTVGLCDKRVALDNFCPVAIDYIRAARQVNLPPGDEKDIPGTQRKEIDPSECTDTVIT